MSPGPDHKAGHPCKQKPAYWGYQQGTAETLQTGASIPYIRVSKKPPPQPEPTENPKPNEHDMIERQMTSGRSKGLTILSALLLIATTASMNAAGIFKTIKAESKGDEITIVWRTDGEAGYHTFEVERRSTEVPQYRRIGSIVVRGSGGTYSFVDNGAFFKTEADKEFTYRIRAIGGNGVEAYSPPVSVSHRVVSSVKRSWGMIKELFR